MQCFLTKETSDSAVRMAPAPGGDDQADELIIDQELVEFGAQVIRDRRLDGARIAEYCAA